MDDNDITNDNSRFVLNFNDVTFLDSDNNPINKSTEEIAKEQANDIICFDEIEIGDIVLTRKPKKFVIITDINYEIKDLNGYFDFAGFEIGGNRDYKDLLNRNNIQKVCQKARDLINNKKLG